MSEVTGAQTWGVVLCFLVAAAAGLGGVSRVIVAWVTVVHELGHAVMALGAAGRVRHIKLRWDGSGLTSWSTRQRRAVPRAIVAAAGYTTPPLVGALAAVAATSRYPEEAAAGVAITAVLVAVVWMRSWWGLGSTLVFAAILGAAAAAGGGPARLALAALAGLLVGGGLRAAAGTGRAARRGDGSDQAELAAITRLPVWAWAGLLTATATVFAAGAVGVVAMAATST